MAWWKLSSETMNLHVFKEISKSLCRGDRPEIRLIALIKLICDSANGNTFKTSSDFAFITGTSKKQAEIVWNIMIAENALREKNGEFSALEWMRENKLIGSETANKAVARQIRRNTPIPEEKTQFSAHVSLSAVEHTELVKTLGERKFQAVIDKLENYKATTGKTYDSDFDAINRWVIDAVEKDDAQSAAFDESKREAYQVLDDDEMFKKTHYGKTREEYAAQKAWQNSEEGKRQIEGYKRKLQMILGGSNGSSE